MAIKASFSPGAGLLSVFGDALDDQITLSRDAAGRILINGGAIPVLGGQPTVANTALMQVFGQGGNDTITLDESNGALPAAQLFGGNGNDTLFAGSGGGTLSGRGGGDRYVLNDKGVDLVKDSTADLDGAAIKNFSPQDAIDLTDLGLGGKVTLVYAPAGTHGTLSLSDGTHNAAILLLGSFSAAGFHTAGDGGTGTLVTYTPVSGQQAMLVAPH